MFPSWIVAIYLFVAPVWGIALPELTGPHPVGTVSIHLTDHERLDPIAKDGSLRSIMASVFYPALTSGSEEYTRAPVFTPKQASWTDDYIGLKEGTAASIFARSRLRAPISGGSRFPILLFSHGAAMSREMHTSGLEDLASHGWVIVAVSHPGDANFVEFPDGSVVINNGSYPPFSGYPDNRYEAIDIRVADMLFLAEALRNGNVASHIPGLDVNLPTEKIGTFGHSFGGATASQMLLNASSVAAAANLDGTQYSALATSGTDKPVVIMSTPEHNVTCDPRCDSTWPEMWPLLTGYRREVTVANATHDSYTDYVVFKDIAEIGMPPAWVAVSGDIEGTRMREIQTQYLNAYFGKWLKDDSGELLNGNSTSYPEVLLRK